MFYSIRGIIVFFDAQSIAVECAGVAFRILTSLNTIQKTGGTGTEVTLYTYLAVREDAMELYGFYDMKELDLFKQLISVSGVGPKAAIAVLSQLTPDALVFAIVSGDVKAITRAQGVGPKIAQRIVLELKEKLGKNVPAEMSAADINSTSGLFAGGNVSEAVSALISLGYSQTESSAALKNSDPSQSIEALVKEGLKNLMRGI